MDIVNREWRKELRKNEGSEQELRQIFKEKLERFREVWLEERAERFIEWKEQQLKKRSIEKSVETPTRRYLMVDGSI